MSLKTDFIAKEKKAELANTYAEFILNGQPFMENPNSWKCKYYNTTTSSAPTLSTISGLTPTKTMIKADFSTYVDWQWGNNYVGSMECWVKCTQNYSLSTSFYTDDEGRIYLNESSVTTSQSCKSTSVTLNLKEGWNHIQILFREGSGGDGACLETLLSSKSYVEFMYANKSGE